MSISSRFAVGVHILTLLAESKGRPVTSEWIAGSVNTNPAVIRRILSMLAKAGITTSQLGAGGGSLLAKEPEAINLLEVYHAVDDGELFCLHNELPNGGCHVGRHIQTALTDCTGRAQRALEAELADQTIAQIVNQVKERQAPV